MTVLRKRVAAAGVVASALLLAACTGGGTSSESTSTAASAPAAAASSAASEPASDAAASGAASEAPAATGDGIKIAMVGGKSDDPFFSTVKRGADDAAAYVEANGGSFDYLALANYDNLGVDAAKLTDTGVANGANIILVPVWVPEAQNPAIQRAKDAGVAVLVYNSGADQVEKVGSIGYVGADDHTSGVLGGEYLAKNGVNNVLCVNTAPGAVNLEARCSGIEEGEKANGGKSKQLPLPSSNFGDPTAVSQAIKAALLQDPSINGVVTMGSQDAASSAAAIDQAGLGGKVKVGSFDVAADALSRIQDGTQMMLIDQQGYLQGFNSVALAMQYLKWGLKFPQAVLTGPAIIDSSNVDLVVAGAKEGVR